MLKAPSVNPWVYIYGYYILELTGQTSVLHLSILFLHPQCCKPRILEDSTEKVKTQGLAGGAFSIRRSAGTT